MEAAPSEIKVQRGAIFVYRVFDISEEVDLRAVESILSQQPGRESRLKLAKGSQAVVVRNAPVRISLGETEAKFRGETLRLETYATVWDYGVISISFAIPIKPGTSWSQLLATAALIYADQSGESQFDPTARQRSRELVQLIRPALKKPSEWSVSEDYVIYFLEQVEGIKRGSELLERADIPALILGEAENTLAEKARRGILENTYQYAQDDLVVIDWNSALVLEPSGQRDIPDVLEFALTHLLEVRYYDDLLDRRLTELYDTIEQRRQTLLRSVFSALSRDANTRFLEFSEFMERIDNSLKVVGDFYLAVIFRGAVRRFRIMDWQQTITRKINLLARVSELLQGEINVYRSQLLEIIIVLLFLFELISAVIRVKHP